MSPESWQTICPRCGWANSGAERRCMKCGQPLRTSPGLLIAGQTAGSAIAPQSLAPAKRVVQPGGFFPRLIAAIIDGLLLAVIIVPVIYLWQAGQQTAHLAAGSQGNVATDVLRSAGGAALNQYSADQLNQLIALLAGLQILALFYYAGTWSILGGSPGQLLMSLRIVDSNARTIGFGRALLRYIAKGLFGILAPVSALMVAFGKDKRAVHDLLAGTYVIQFLDPTAANLPTAQQPGTEAAPPPTMSVAPPAPAPPEPAYAGAAIAAAAVSSEAPMAPTQAPAAPPPPAPPPAPPDPGASAFASYSAPSSEPALAPPPMPPPEAAPPGPAAASEVAPQSPPESPAAGLPVFPTGQPGELPAMAPRPAEPLSQTARPPAPAAPQPPPQAPYAVPFAPAPPPPDPPTPSPPED